MTQRPHRILGIVTVAVVTGASGGLGQTVDHRTTIDSLQRIVTTQVAEQWGVASGKVAMEWATPPDSLLAGIRRVEVRGPGRNGRFLAVLHRDGEKPQAVRFRAGVRQPVPVATRPLTRGTTLVAGDWTDASRTVWGPPDSTVQTVTEGWRVRRAVATGDVLAPPAVTPPPIIQIGDRVALSWERGDVRIVVEGVALNTAARGRRITVRLADRRGNARGVAVGPGRGRLESRQIR